MDHDKASNTPSDSSAARAANAGGLRLDRRRLLRAGASTTPVLLSLASTPVAAGNCVVASSFVSVATFKSRNPTTTTVQCTGYNVEYWRALSPRPSEINSNTISQWLGATSPSSTYGSYKLSAIIDLATNTSGELGVAQHLTALSMCCYKYPGSLGNISKPYLAAIWSNYKTNGNMYVLPAAGISWDSAKLITWLRYLMYANTI